MCYDLFKLFLEKQDENAFLALQKEYGGLVIYFAKKMYSKTKLLNEDLEDCIQFCWLWFIKIARKFDFDSDANFKAYLVVSFSRYINNHIRDLFSHKENNFNISIETILLNEKTVTYSETLESEDDLPSRKYELNEASEKFNSLDNIKKVERMIFIYYLQGYTYKEISLKFSLGEKKIDNIIRKIKARLKQE